MKNRKMIFAPLFIGLMICVLPLTRNPRFEAYRAVDVVQLVAAGMCFGVALTVAIGRFRREK